MVRMGWVGQDGVWVEGGRGSHLTGFHREGDLSLYKKSHVTNPEQCACYTGTIVIYHQHKPAKRKKFSKH